MRISGHLWVHALCARKGAERHAPVRTAHATQSVPMSCGPI